MNFGVPAVFARTVCVAALCAAQLQMIAPAQTVQQSAVAAEKKTGKAELSASSDRGNSEKPNTETQSVRMPKPKKVLMLINATMLAVDRGNRSGDYSELHARLAPSVSAKVDVRQLARALAVFRERNVDLAGIIAEPPQFVRGPALDKSGLLTMAGLFSTGPQAVRFELAFRRIEGQWLVEVLNVNATDPLAASKASAQGVQEVPNTASTSDSPSNSPRQASSMSSRTELTKAETTQRPASSAGNFESPHLDRSTDPPTTIKW